MSDDTPDRFWETCVVQVLGKLGDKNPKQKDLNTIGWLFEHAGGLWEGLAAGDTDQWDLLRRACKVYLKRKLKKKDEDEKQ